MSDLTIARVQTLTGHTGPDSAYVVEDYPYGFRLRCSMRHWIDTADKGSAKGQQRWTTQTTNPKVAGTVWNKPKSGTYSPFVVLYLDDKGHVQAHHVRTWITGADDIRTRRMGVYDALSDSERRVYDAMLAFSRKVNPTTWEEWETTVGLIADHIRETGRDPEITGNQTWQGPGRSYYLTDPAAYVTAARERLAVV